MPKISVIIAVYGAEKYIEKCARSLFEQTLDDIEYIFVDDCTPDKSIEILSTIIEDYPHRKKQVKIIHNKTNLKQGGTRSVGMKAATGDYLIHCDPDDWVETNMYELLYNKAIEDKADIVVCDFYHEFPNGRKVEHYTPIPNPIDCINKSAETKYWWSLWNRLFHKKFTSTYKIYPPNDFYYLEDKFQCVKSYIKASKISYIDIPLYHYLRTNETSMCNTVNDAIDLYGQINCLNKLLPVFKNENVYNQLLPFINLHKINFRDRILLYSPIDFFKWRNTYPEIVNVIVNDKNLKLSYRICYLLAQKGFTLPLVMYISFSNRRRQ